MPQFDFISFFTQLFWFFLAVFFLYLVFFKYYAKTIAEVIKIRTKLFDFAQIMKNKILYSDLYNNVIKQFKRR